MYSVRAEDQIIAAVDNYQSTMRQIRVKKDDLLKIIEKNSKEHHAAFLEAQKAYRKLVIQELDRQLRTARKGGPLNFVRLVQVQAPEDHTSDYARTIKMLNMSLDKEIMIDEREFQNYVEDRWEWSRDWAANSLNYVNKNSRHYGKISALANS